MNDQISSKLSSIADVLQQHTPETPGLTGGKAGAALFFFYYSQLTHDEKYSESGFSLLADIFDEINDGFSQHTFSGGLAGIAWTIEHLVQNGFLDKETSEVLNELDPFLYEAMMADLTAGNYDFLHGASGTATYFLSRPKTDKTQHYLNTFIDELEKQAEIEPDGAIKWKSLLDHQTGEMGYNISLSHGIASIIALLGKLYEQDICREKVFRLITGAVTYLLKQELDTEKHISCFPSLALESETGSNHGSRLAWCYGDLGIAIALWQAAQSTGNRQWQQKALDILVHSTHRKELIENSVVDAGLCHGTAGIAHIYNRTYGYTGMETFKQSANYWFDQTLKMAKFDDGLAGYKAYRLKEFGGPITEGGFLEGIAGVGLALISAVSDISPQWDRALLLS